MTLHLEQLWQGNLIHLPLGDSFINQTSFLIPGLWESSFTRGRATLYVYDSSPLLKKTCRGILRRFARRGAITLIFYTITHNLFAERRRVFTCPFFNAATGLIAARRNEACSRRVPPPTSALIRRQYAQAQPPLIRGRVGGEGNGIHGARRKVPRVSCFFPSKQNKQNAQPTTIRAGF